MEYPAIITSSPEGGEHTEDEMKRRYGFSGIFSKRGAIKCQVKIRLTHAEILESYESRM